MKISFVSLFAAATLLVQMPLAQAEDMTPVTLRIHHFMSAKGTSHQEILVPLAERLERESDGRIKVELFDSMSLGGRARDLYDQAVDGAVDVVLTLPGYTAGRFNRTEVFELPFMMDDSVATSKAFWDFITSDLQEGEYYETKILSGWVHGPGVIHSKQPIAKLEDLKGMELRGPTRAVTDMLDIFGASPVGMPLPQVSESLSKGVISGALLPWEVTPSVHIPELVNYHTELGDNPALYTATFILAMNRDAYDKLPADLRAILDAETGKKLSAMAGKAMADADALGRQAAAGNQIIHLDRAEVARWIEAAQTVYNRWEARSADRGFDGTGTVKQAKELIAANK